MDNSKIVEDRGDDGVHVHKRLMALTDLDCAIPFIRGNDLTRSKHCIYDVLLEKDQGREEECNILEIYSPVHSETVEKIWRP